MVWALKVTPDEAAAAAAEAALLALHGGVGAWEEPLVGTLIDFDIWPEEYRTLSLMKCKLACVQAQPSCFAIDFAPFPTEKCPNGSCGSAPDE